MITPERVTLTSDATTPESWEMRRYQVSVNDGSISVDVHGRGQNPPLIVVPGVMSDAEAWDTVASHLAIDREVHVINRRGRQPSSNLPDDYSFLTEVEDLKAVLENVATPAHVFGWSLGGLIALQAVAAGAEALSLVLYEPVMSPFGREQLGALRAARTRDDFDAMVQIVNRDISGYSQGHVDALRQNPKSWTRLCLLAMPLADEIQALINFAPDLENYLTLQTHVTVIHGTQSGSVYDEPGRLIVRSLAHTNVVALQDQDHLVHLAAPEILVEAIRKSMAD